MAFGKLAFIQSNRTDAYIFVGMFFPWNWHRKIGIRLKPYRRQTIS